jgi:uncharacterized membrane protein (DUF485 family)
MGWGLTCLGVCVLLAAGLAATPAAAALPAPECTIEAGFDGLIGRDAVVFPLRVTLANQAADAEGVLELFSPEPSGQADVRYTLPFSLPVQSKKRFELLGALQAGREPVLQIRFDRNLAGFREPLRINRAKTPLVLGVGTPRGFEPSLAGKAYTFLRLAEDRLPSDPVAYDGVHAVILSGPAFLRLTSGQVEALRVWTAAGGTTILLDPLPDEGFRRSWARVAGPAAAAVGSAGLVRVGAGLAAHGPAGVEPGAFWDQQPGLRDAIFPAAAAEDTNRGWRWTSLFQELFQTRSRFGALNILFVGLIILVYMLAIGPLDRWLVRRAQRPALTWVLFPAGIAVFSVLAWLYSSRANVGRTYVVAVVVADASEPGLPARVNARFRLYSARNTVYAIRSLVENAFLMARETTASAGGAAGVEIRNGRDSRIRARIPIFSGREFGGLWYQSWPHALVWGREGGRRTVTLPPGLRAGSAFIARESGVSLLERRPEPAAAAESDAGEVWIETEEQPWSVLLEQINKTVETLWQRRWRRDSDDWALAGEEPPPNDPLRHYALLTSFHARLLAARAPAGSGNASRSNWAERMDEQESDLDASERLARGPLLVLSLVEPSPLFALDFGSDEPLVWQATLVRLPVPETAAPPNGAGGI